MVLQEYKPSLILSEYIRTFRLVNFDYKSDGALPAKAYPPRPEHCLSFYARDFEKVEYQSSKIQTGNLSTVLFGFQTEVTHRFSGSDTLLIQVVFKPGGLYRFTGLPSNLLTNQYIDAQTVFSNEIKNVNEALWFKNYFDALSRTIKFNKVSTLTSNMFYKIYILLNNSNTKFIFLKIVN